MKVIILSLALLVVFSPVYGQLSDATGLVSRLDVQSGGQSFEVKIVANFDVNNHDFDPDEKSLTIYIDSNLENNFGEMIIPANLLGGNYTFFLNDQEHFSMVRHNGDIYFVVLNFTGSGSNQLKIYGTESVINVTETTNDDVDGGGCLVATAAFGTELSLPVQQLRELRDTKLVSIPLGKNFLDSFNAFYYSFSPVIADYQRENSMFNDMIKLAITPLINSLFLLQHVEINSDAQVLVYGAGIILLNIGMYVGVPASIIFVSRSLCRH